MTYEETKALFRVGDKVRLKSAAGPWIHGEVIGVGEGAITVQWDEWCKKMTHNSDAFRLIHVIDPSKVYQVGARVKRWDRHDNEWAYGGVTEVGSTHIVVQWDDQTYYFNEFDEIIVENDQ